MARTDQYDGSLAFCHYGWVERWLRWRVGTFPGGLIRSLSPGAGLHHSVSHCTVLHRGVVQGMLV